MVGSIEKRPVADAAEATKIFFTEATAILDGYKREGEVRLVFDLLKWKEVLTIHIPLPKEI